MKNYGILGILCLAIGCSNNAPQYDKAASASEYAEASVREASEESEEGDLMQSANGYLAFQNPPQSTEQSTEPVKKTQPKIIKTATVNMQVEDFDKDDQRIRDLIKMMEGYISQENQGNEYYRKVNTLVVRLNPDKLDNFLHQLNKIGKKVIHQSVNSQDVTKEFVDMEIRIQSKTEVINRYRELLKKANTVEEILRVENELRVIVEELEAVKGRLNYLKNQVGLSTVTIEYFQAIDQVDIDKPGFFTNLGDALSDGWDGLKGFVIGLVTIWPFLIIFGFGVYFVRRFWRNKKA